MNPTAADVREYDRFGPWIDEVAVPEDVPKLFGSHPIDLTTTRIVLKVPRNVARRDAVAGMDLYDHLVILDEERLTVLSRRDAKAARAVTGGDGTGYDVRSVQVADVVAIRDDLNLLDGRLTVSSSGGTSISFGYNGSAHDKATRFVDELRSRAGAARVSSVGSALMRAGSAVTDVQAVPNPGAADTYLVSRFLKLRAANPGLTVWASHGRQRVFPQLGGLRGALTRASHAVSPMTLHGAAFLADGTALEVLGRRDWLARGRGPDYSTLRLLIPLGAPDGLEVVAHAVYPNVAVATIRVGGWSTEIAVPRESEAERLLSAAAPGRPGLRSPPTEP